MLKVKEKTEDLQKKLPGYCLAGVEGSRYLVYVMKATTKQLEEARAVCVWPGREIRKSPRNFLLFLREARNLGASLSRVYDLGRLNKLDDYLPGWEQTLIAPDEPTTLSPEDLTATFGVS